MRRSRRSANTRSRWRSIRKSKSQSRLPSPAAPMKRNALRAAKTLASDELKPRRKQPQRQPQQRPCSTLKRQRRAVPNKPTAKAMRQRRPQVRLRPSPPKPRKGKRRAKAAPRRHVLSFGLSAVSGLPFSAGFGAPAAGAWDLESTAFGSGARMSEGFESTGLESVDFGPPVPISEGFLPASFSPGFASNFFFGPALAFSSPLAPRLPTRAGDAGPLSIDFK